MARLALPTPDPESGAELITSWWAIGRVDLSPMDALHIETLFVIRVGVGSARRVARKLTQVSDERTERSDRRTHPNQGGRMVERGPSSTAQLVRSHSATATADGSDW